jgi:hypothetical protein
MPTRPVTGSAYEIEIRPQRINATIAGFFHRRKQGEKSL